MARMLNPINSHIIHLALVILALAVASRATPAKHLRRVATPVRQNSEDKPPRIEDTLAVAKSPFEPITIAHSLTDARHHEPSGESLLLETTKSIQGELNAESAARTTRAAQDAGDQQQETSAATKGLDESTGLRDASTKSVGSDQPATPGLPDSESTGTTDSPAEDEETTTTAPSATTTTPEPAAPTTTQTPSTTAEPSEAATEAPTTTTTTTTTPAPTTTEAPATTTVTTTTEQAPAKTDAPEKADAGEAAATTVAPPETTKEEENEKNGAEVADGKPATPSTTESAPSSTTEAPSVSENTEAPKPALTNEQPPRVEKVESVQVTPTTASPAIETATTSEESPSTTAASSTGANSQQQSNQQSSCNHLPTYNSDEVQKVFREETTYKNGTIKGKFTYINFDQRYRLVHYTRLPYGPVKVDFVEELGKPVQANSSHSTPASPNDIPNAVLQLRNILPNSLFGFPFTSANSGQVRPLSGGIGPREGLVGGNQGSDDNSNTYFYSTDSISTPNLLTPTVPVSVPPGQRPNLGQANPNSPSIDAIGQSFLDQSVQQPGIAANLQQKPLPVPAFAPLAAVAGPATDGKPGDKLPSIESKPPNHRFRYAEAPNHKQLINAQQNPKGDPRLVYTYLTQAQAPQYQYSPIPLHQPLHHHGIQPSAQARALIAHPAYGPPQHPHHLASDYNRQADYNGGLLSHQHPHQHPANLHTSYHHQPHGHEHFMAPFMYVQQQQQHQRSEQADGEPKVRLRVKTSKSLNPGAKSAQLRAPSSGHYSSVQNSPAQAIRFQQRQHRLGKQSHELRSAPSSPTVNTSPVVYHVLRSPLGQVYSLPQYGEQNYAVAYDRS